MGPSHFDVGVPLMQWVTGRLYRALIFIISGVLKQVGIVTPQVDINISCKGRHIGRSLVEKIM